MNELCHDHVLVCTTRSTQRSMAPGAIVLLLWGLRCVQSTDSFRFLLHDQVPQTPSIKQLPSKTTKQITNALRKSYIQHGKLQMKGIWATEQRNAREQRIWLTTESKDMMITCHWELLQFRVVPTQPCSQWRCCGLGSVCLFLFCVPGNMFITYTCP